MTVAAPPAPAVASDITLRDFWIDVIRRLEPKVQRGLFITWFRNTTVLGKEEGNLVVGLPLPMFLNWHMEHYRAITLQEAQELLSGGQFSAAIEKSGLFEPMHEKMIRFGSAAGKLDAVMEKLSGIYMSEADDSIHNVIAMIEPTLVALLCVVIGGILLSVMLPLLSVLSAVG